MSTKYALAVDGGGVRGIFSAAFLKELEKFLIEGKYIKENITELFTIFVGTSTGAIIAGALATGKYSAKQVCDDVYTNENAKKIFSGKQNCVKYKMQLVPKYHARPRYDVGLDVFGEMKMYDLTHKLIVTTYNLRCRKPCFWTNIGPGYNPKAIDVIMASSAAPTYFPAEQIFYDEEKTCDGGGFENFDVTELKSLTANPESGDGYIDGGVACNSPSTIAYAYTKQMYCKPQQYEDGTCEATPTKVKILSVGTGADLKPIKFEDAQNAGGLWWLTQGELISITMDSSDQVNQIESELLNSQNFLRINLTHIDEEYVSLAMDDVDDENMNKLRRLGASMMETFKKELVDFIGT